MGWKYFRNNTKLEKRVILFAVVLCVIVLVLFILLLSRHDPQICDSPECVRAATHILDTVDPTVDPCQDFYKFACGTFLKNAFSLGQPTTLHPLRTLMRNKLKEIVVERDEKRNLTRALLMQRKFYKTCMNDTAIRADNDTTFLNLLNEVTGGWPAVKADWNGRKFNWTNSMIAARKLGLFYQFYFQVSIFSGNDSTNMLWIKPPSGKDFEMFHWKEENRELITQIASDLGVRTVDTYTEIGHTLNFAEELNLIAQKYNNDTLKNEHSSRRQSTIRDLKHHRIDINWFKLLQQLTDVKVTEDDVVVFDVDDYLEKLYHLLLKTQRKIQANYMAMVLVFSNIQYMTKRIREKDMKMRKLTNNTELSSSRNDLCYDIAHELFKNVAEGAYVRRYTLPSRREYITEIIKNIKAELQSVLEDIHWMDEETKSYALQHLKNITEEIGWTKLVYNPEKYESEFGYHQVNMTSDKLVDMARLMNVHEVNRYYHQIRQTVTEEEEDFVNTPKLDVNAFYLKYFDKLILPTPILQGNVIDERRPHYMNYGALGSIIGHEFMHGFIEHSSDGEVDEDSWWTNRTIKHFKNISQCIRDDYDRYPDKGSFTKSGSIFEENIADFSAVNLAYTAYRTWTSRNTLGEKLPGIRYTADQLFWIMTSTYLCYEPKLWEKDESRRKVSLHAIASYRVMGRLKNSPHFARAFNCPVGSPMNPQNKCKIFA